ncbi:helix-turn-helix domain-containing protein [Microbacterium esteraromaticum]|uniref:helix-turn-helix domain-containing protein n=1 Tax=Microbacterium esteraromaticum TaxID=57043 RepID=UPI0021752421|nr:helix-turn-helix domain-containing protein [Microbacterium esteraromaticum]
MDTEHSPAGNPWGLEPLLDVGELAAYLGVPVSSVYDWRARGLGPRAYRFGKHLKFALSDVRTWIEQQRDPEPPVFPEGDDPMSRQRLTIGTFGEIGHLVRWPAQVEPRYPRFGTCHVRPRHSGLSGKRPRTCGFLRRVHRPRALRTGRAGVPRDPPCRAAPTSPPPGVSLTIEDGD